MFIMGYGELIVKKRDFLQCAINIDHCGIGLRLTKGFSMAIDFSNFVNVLSNTKTPIRTEEEKDVFGEICMEILKKTGVDKEISRLKCENRTLEKEIKDLKRSVENLRWMKR
jgi:hypothetical protein